MLSNCFKLVVSIDPYYFFKLDQNTYIFLEVPLKEETKLNISNKTCFETQSLKIYDIIYQNEEVGFLLKSEIATKNSGAYLLSTKPIQKAAATEQIYKQGHIAVYCFEQGQFLCVSSKLSSTTESILEEQ